MLTQEKIQEMYNWSLERKIEESVNRIIDWHVRNDGKTFVSFSGGLDSTVLLDLVRSKAGYTNIPAVFAHTGLEFPENVEFIKTFDNVHIVRPKMNFPQVIEKYGYPVCSKRIAQYIHEVRAAKTDTPTKKLRLTGLKSNGDVSKIGAIPTVWKPLIDAPFKISDRCCHYLKKEPLIRAQKLFGAPFIGTRAQESQQRELAYKRHGCNVYTAKQPKSTPIVFWTTQDVKEYITKFNIRCSKLYSLGYERSGCMWCMFGAHHKEDVRFALLEVTHPRIFRYCRDELKLFEVLGYVKNLWDNRFSR